MGERDLFFYYWSVQLLILKLRFLTSDCFIQYAFFKRSQRYVAFCSQWKFDQWWRIFAVVLFEKVKQTLTFSIWHCDQFDLDLLTDDECKPEFRFYKKDVYLLTEVLQVLDQIRCYNCVIVDGIEALCIFLKGFTYPWWYFDMLSRFARPILQLCMKSKWVMDFIYQTHHHRLKNFNQPCLSQASLQNYTEVIHVTGAPLRICWGFIDGTIRPVSRPGKNQRVLYNGHKRVHAIKFQSIAAPNSLIANLFGPVERMGAAR